MASYQYAQFPYRDPPELKGAPANRYSVVVIGAGPVGLTAAIDLALHDVPALWLDDSDVTSSGSRAICWSKHCLAIWARLGVAYRMLAKGVTWNVALAYPGEMQLLT